MVDGGHEVGQAGLTVDEVGGCGLDQDVGDARADDVRSAHARPAIAWEHFDPAAPAQVVQEPPDREPVGGNRGAAGIWLDNSNGVTVHDCWISALGTGIGARLALPDFYPVNLLIFMLVFGMIFGFIFHLYQWALRGVRLPFRRP